MSARSSKKEKTKSGSKHEVPVATYRTDDGEGVFGFKKESQVPFGSTILKPICVNGANGPDVRWQPKETTIEKQQRIRKVLEKTNVTKTEKMISKWKKQGKMKDINSYFQKK